MESLWVVLALVQISALHSSFSIHIMIKYRIIATTQIATTHGPLIPVLSLFSHSVLQRVYLFKRPIDITENIVKSLHSDDFFFGYFPSSYCS